MTIHACVHKCKAIPSIQNAELGPVQSDSPLPALHTCHYSWCSYYRLRVAQSVEQHVQKTCIQFTEENKTSNMNKSSEFHTMQDERLKQTHLGTALEGEEEEEDEERGKCTDKSLDSISKRHPNTRES